MIPNSFAHQLFILLPQPSILLKADAPSFTIAAANAAYIAITKKHTEVDLIGKSIFEIVTNNAEEKNNLKTLLTSVLEAGTPQEMLLQKCFSTAPDYNHLEVKNYTVKHIPIIDEEGNVTHILQTIENITDSVQVEQKEEILQSIDTNNKVFSSNLEPSAVIGSWDLDLETEDFYWSPEFFEICGYSPNSFTPSLSKALEIIHPSDHEAVIEAFNNALVKGLPYRIEHRIITASNDVATVLATGMVTKNKEGKHIRLTGFFQNITVQKQQNQLLQKTLEGLINSEKRYKQLFENNPSPMFIWDFKTLQIVDCNEEALLLYGYSKQEFLGLNILEISPKEEQYEIETINKSEESYHKVGKRVWRHFRKDGSIIHVFIVGHLIEYKGRKASLVCLNDVTEKIIAKEKLQESETRYKSFFKNSLDANLLSIENGNIIAANTVACNMFGYNEDEFCKLTRQDIADITDERLLKLLSDKKATGHGEAIHRFFRKDGSIFEAFVSSTEYKDSNGDTRNAVIIKDVTEKIKAENELKDSEAKYRSFFENSFDGNIISIENGNIISVNHVACTMFGYSTEEFSQLTRKDITDSSDIRLHKLLKDKRETGHGESIIRAIKKNGEIFEAHVSSTSFKHTNGEERNVVTFKDITENIVAELALKESEAKYRSLFENAMDATMFTEPCGKILEANAAACNMFKMTEAEICELGRSGIVDVTDERLVAFVNERNKNGSVNTNLRCIRKNGELFETEISSTLYTDINGVKRCIVTIKDITEIIKAEQAIKESEARYRLFFENSTNANFITKADGSIIIANQIASNIFGYSVAELCQMNRAQLADMTDPRIVKMKIDNDSNGFAAGVHRILLKNGQTTDAYTHINQFYDAQGEERYALVVKDLSEQQKAEQALKESEARYRLFFENGINASFIAKHDGSIVVANQMASNMFGYSVAELCQMNRAQLADMTDPRLIKLIRDKEANGNAAGIHRFFYKNGQTFDGFLSSNIYFDANGEERSAIIIKDLSEQQKAEAALVESEKKYRLLFYQSPIPKWIYEIETYKIIDVNEAAIIHYGYTREEFLNINILDLSPTKEVNKLLAENELNSTSNKNDIYNVGKFIHKKKNGHIITVDISSIPLEYETKKCKLVIATDITDVEYALKELALSNERFHYVSKATSDAIWDWDVVNDKLLLGDGFEEKFGHKIEEKSASISFLLNNVHPDDKQQAVHTFYRIVKSKEAQCRDEFRFKKADGSYAYVVNKGIVIRNELGRTIRIVGGMQDITKNKKELLRLQLLESVITNTADMVIITEAESTHGWDPKIVYVNEAFTKRTGYTSEEAVGSTPSMLQGPKTDRKELDRLVESLKKWEPCSITVVNYTKQGEEFWNNISVSPVADSAGWFTHWVAIERDVTEKVQHQTELIKTIIKTQEEERYEIGGELHDNVCQILTTSKISFKMVEKSLPDDKLSQFNDGIETLNLAFKEIRNLSHRLAPVFFDDTTLEQAFANTLKAFNVNDIFKIILEFDDAFTVYPATKEFQLNLHRILQEQLNNILKYAQATTITVEGIIKNNQIILSISDDGIGFNSNYVGSGIGLSNMKRRAELFDGKFIIDTSPGKGCKISVEIPLKDVTL